MAYRARSRTASVARWMDLKYPGKCAGVCEKELPKGTRAFYDPSDRTVCCTDMACAARHGVTEPKWVGSPTSGSWVTVLSELRLPSPPCAEHSAAADPFRRSRSRGYTGRNPVRCEDAPCCGCCAA